MGNRPRIKSKVNEPMPVVDALAFVKNKSSENARPIEMLVEGINIEIWHDKHYAIRQQFGDENGRREGIEQEIVMKLIRGAVKHLFYYSFKVKFFSFISDEGQHLRYPRIILQKEDLDGILLNVAIELHCISLDKYEITVFTAMKKDDFKMSQGQFAIQLYGNSESELKKFENGKLLTISNI